MKYVIGLLSAAILFAGCECFLPSGKAPEGTIVTNPGTAAVLIFDRRAALDYFINELIRETMLHCSGEQIFVDADPDSKRAADYIVDRAGEFSGIQKSLTSGKGALRLISRNIAGNQWQMELVSASGESLWKRRITIKTN